MPSSAHPLPRAHLVQLDIAWENRPVNYRRTLALVEQAAPAPGDLIILPEMFDTGFSCNLAATVDSDGATLAFLTELARRFAATVHGQRTVHDPDQRARNRASIVGPDGTLLCEYDKSCLFPLGQARESEFFAPGRGPTTYTWTHAGGTSVASVCPTICYDLRFPELYRRALSMGAEIFVVSSSWPDTREEHRRILSIARAIENQAFVLSVNRCGRDPALAYAGGSLAVGPRGEVLGALGPEEGVLSIEIDMRDLHSWRADFPAWRAAAPFTS